MSAFEATIRVGEVQVEVAEDERGKKYQANLVLGVLALAPAGPQQVIPIPLGALKVPLDKDSIGSVIQSLQSAYDAMEKRPDLQIASNLDGLPDGLPR